MAFMNMLNITGSALTAERLRMDIITQNLTHASTTRTENGEPYRRKQVVFAEQKMNFENALRFAENTATGGGVRVDQIVESQAPFTPVYDPTHPDADETGYVMYPNVSRSEEQVDLMASTRAYEANLTALGVVKSMMLKALEIGK